MSKSLQDQLVQAGLADPAQARKRGRDDRRKGKGKGKGRGKAAAKKKSSAGGKAAGTDRGGKGSRPDRGTGQRPDSARERTARLRQLVKESRLDRSAADTPYRFTAGRRVKEITVTAAQQGQLARGEAGIVNVQGHFDVLPAAAIEQVRALDEKAVVLLNVPDGAGDAPDGDDPYADRPVPDDLTW